MPHKFKFLFFATAVLFSGLFLVAPGSASAATNISATSTMHWAWNDVVGWIDHYGTLNINVTNPGLTGYASSSVGYIALDCATAPIPDCTYPYQVGNGGGGHLSGWAWNDNVGWISFCGVVGGSAKCPNTAYNYSVNIDSNTGKFTGWAWNDVIGWISFCNSGSDCSGSAFTYDVETSWRAVATSSYLESTTYDTGVQGGAILNSVMWLGTQPGGQTSIQFAGSNSSGGPWSYATSTSYTVSPCATVAGCANIQKLDYTLNNARYFRYRIQLTSDQAQSQTPQLNDILINWSP